MANLVRRESELLLYTALDGAVKVGVLFKDETVWLTQAAIAELFQTTPQNITLHLAAIYQEGELEEDARHIGIPVRRAFFTQILPARSGPR